ncbi:MAG: hypothetical protein IPK12_19610 [Gemmatimonadetes bacterium]|nr:hypothetical protein [Gemmatimonadota bacterium]
MHDDEALHPGPVWVPVSLDERAEVELTERFAAAERVVGAAEFRRVMLRWLLPLEERLRAGAPANHPGVALLDAYHAECARGGHPGALRARAVTVHPAPGTARPAWLAARGTGAPD